MACNTLIPYTGTMPNSGTLTPSEEQQACRDYRMWHQDTYIPWLGLNFPKICAASELANLVFYKGEWGAVGTPTSLDIGESVSIGDIFYVSKIDGNTDTPPSANWLTIEPIIEDPIVIGAWQNLTLSGSFTGYFKIRETIFNANVRLIEIEASLNHPSVSNGTERKITQIPLGFRPQYDTSLIFYKMGGLYPYSSNGFILMDYDGSVLPIDEGYVGIKFEGGDSASRYKTGTSYFIIEETI